MAEGPLPKRKRQEEEAAAAAADGGTAASAAPFPLAELRLRRVLRESARDKTVFLHGEVLGGEAGPGQAAAVFPRRGLATPPQATPLATGHAPRRVGGTMGACPVAHLPSPVLQ